MVDKKPAKIRNCAVCGENNKVKLLNKDYHYYSQEKNIEYSGKVWYYTCESCGEEFTTTESDTISLENLNENTEIRLN